MPTANIDGARHDYVTAGDGSIASMFFRNQIKVKERKMNKFEYVASGAASYSTRLSNDGNQVAGYKPLKWLMSFLLAALVTGCGGGDGSGAGPADTTAPTISSTAIVPADAATAIALNANITASFSEAMDAATITTVTFTLTQGGAPVAGTVTYVGTTAIFNPTSDLAASTVYTATVTTGVKDVAGNALAAARTWSFTTGTTADATAPTVNSTVPADIATGIAANANITATFSEVMDPSTITTTTLTLAQGITPIAGAVTYVGTTAIFNPTSDLAVSTTYTATVTTGVKDLAGNALVAAKTWSFTTGTAVAAGPAPVVLG
ncbi:MAG: Ig-like domain-containing protein, partial [Solirubrobacteraceae bacterium]|nr:Ig-like domain-containing protein [Solirubrobacteraceae bacterium]